MVLTPNTTFTRKYASMFGDGSLMEFSLLSGRVSRGNSDVTKVTREIISSLISCIKLVEGGEVEKGVF